MAPAGSHPTRTNPIKDPIEDPTDDAVYTRYAAGLPFQRRRTLTAPERLWLTRRVRNARIGGVGVLLGLFASMAAAWGVGLLHAGLAAQFGGAAGLWLVGAGITGCLVSLAHGGWPRIGAGLASLYLLGLATVGALVSELSERPHVVTKIVVVGAIGLGTVVLLTAAARHLLVLTGSRRVRADLRAGLIDCFEGVAPSPTLALRNLRARGYGPTTSASPIRLDVLPASGLVVRVAGRRCAAWVRVHLAAVAAGQPYALRVGLPEGVARGHAAGRLSLRRRSLSPGEQAELHHHIQRLRRRPWAAVLATTGLALAVWWHLINHTTAGWNVVERLLDPMMLGWYALALLTVIAYVRRTIAARKLDDDRRLRWVVTVNAEGEDQLSPPRLEVLPVSQLAWTQDTTPASWRTSKL